MDLPHEPHAVEEAAPDEREGEPRDDDERFIIGLVLTYYRRHPQRARTRLLDLLGEVLLPVDEQPEARRTASPSVPSAADVPSRMDDGSDLWRRSSSGVAPLKRKR